MMTMFSIIVAGVFVFGGLICYASCCAASKADRQSEAYFHLKMQETNMKRKIEDDNKGIR